MGRQAKESEADVIRCETGALQDRACAVQQHAPHFIDAHLNVVGTGFLMSRPHSSIRIEQQELGFGAAAIDSQVHARGFRQKE